MTTPPPDNITRPDFGISVRGYDRAQVDAYFGRVVEWLADAQNRAAAAERARESLAREVTDLRTTVAMLEERAGLPAPQSMSAFSERMGQVMESALQAAQELRAEAERESRERREASAHEAERILAAARDEAEQIVDGARRALRTMEESIGGLRAARVEAVEALLQLQQRISEVVGQPDPELGDPADGGSAGYDDTTTVVPALTTAVPTFHSSDMVDDEDRGGTDVEALEDADSSTPTAVLVTAAPTAVQPAVGPGEDGRAAPARRRRSA